MGNVGFYQRAEVKDALALLRLCAAPDDRQADEAFRRVINIPVRGFGAKAMEILEVEAAWRQVSLLAALETVPLPPKTRSAGHAFADAIRGVGRDTEPTLADQLSLLLDATGYRAMLRQSKAETTEDRFENLQELIQLAGRLPHRPRTARSRRSRDRRTRRGRYRPCAPDDTASRQGAGVHARLPSGLGGWPVSAELRRFRGGMAPMSPTT